jgi:hypothetical protein
MAQGDDILDQADALMRRHRSFVARGDTAGLAATPPADDTPGDGDIPLLTEVVEIVPDATENETAHAVQSRAIEHELDAWLAEILPSRIDALAEQIGEQLLAGLADAARDTLLPRLHAALQARREKE